MEWGKVLTAMVTPMDTAGNIDISKAAELARNIIGLGSDGVILSGTTGEAATLTIQEKLDLFAAVGEEVKGQGLVIAGVGGNCTRDTVSLVHQVEALPIDGYMVITPYYNKPDQKGLIQHYKAVCNACTKPVMLYNVPSRTGTDLSLEDYGLVLAACPQITAVKEAGADPVKASWLVEGFPQVDFFSGNDDLVLPLMVLGFKGVVSVAANVVPGAIAKLTELATYGAWQKARALNSALANLFAALFIETNPIPVKAALELQGWLVGSPRLPLSRLSSAKTAWLAGILNNYTREGQ